MARSHAPVRSVPESDRLAGTNAREAAGRRLPIHIEDVGVKVGVLRVLWSGADERPGEGAAAREAGAQQMSQQAVSLAR